MSSVSQFCTTVRQDDMSCFLEVEWWSLGLNWVMSFGFIQKRSVAPDWIWNWGHTSGAKRCKATEKFLVVPLHFFALQVQLVVLVSAFVMVSTVWSVSCLLFFYSRCLPCPAICKSGEEARAPCSMESAPLKTLLSSLKTLFLCLRLCFRVSKKRWFFSSICFCVMFEYVSWYFNCVNLTVSNGFILCRIIRHLYCAQCVK